MQNEPKPGPSAPATDAGLLCTTLRRNSQNELKPGAFAPGAGAPTLLHGEVAPGAYASDAPGAGASRDSFP